MQEMVDRCCGLDVHKATVMACVRIAKPKGKEEQVRTFSTMTQDLLTLRDWLESMEVTHVAMESTGVFWKPVFNLLEDRFTTILVNPAHMKNVPGRKTDVNDAQWIADLLAHGLLTASFVPPRPVRDLRDLTRYRRALINDRTREVNRLQKFLEDAGIKLSSVASDVLGVSARRMIEAILAGTTDVDVLADLAKGTLRRKIPQLRQALTGHLRGHHAFLLTEILAHVDELDERLERLTAEIGKHMAPFEWAVHLVQDVDGMGRRTAEDILAEIGTDMTRFPTPSHLASWAAICPGHDETAGKRKSGRTRKGNKWLRSALVQAANSAARSKDNYLSAQYRHLVRRTGHKKAVVAVAHSILRILWFLLTNRVTYHDLGSDYFARRNREATTRRHVRQLEALGFRVELRPTDTSAA